jgi:PAS domain S-box-containing protein
MAQGVDRERRAADRASPRADELGAVWDLPSGAIFVVDASLTIRSTNRAYAELVGEEQTSLVGRPLKEVMPLMAAPLSAIVGKVLATGEPSPGVYVPYNFAELSVDALPVGTEGPDRRVALILADTRRRPISAPDGVSGARLRFFEVARLMARAKSDEFDSAVVEALRFATETYRLVRVHVRLLDAERVNYVSAYDYHPADSAHAAPQEITVASVQWMHEQLLRGEAITLSSPDELPTDDKGFREALHRVDVRATFTVPVLEGTRLLGYIAYAAREERVWSKPEINLLRLLGEMIAALVVRGQAEEEFKNRLDFESLLATIARSFVDIAPEDVDAALDRVMREVGERRRLHRVLITMLDDEGALSVTHEWDSPGAPPVGATFTGNVESLSPVVRRVLSGETIAARDTSAAPELAGLLLQMGARMLVLSPLYVEGKIRGVLNVQTSDYRRDALVMYSARVDIFADVISAVLSQRASRERTRRWDRVVTQIFESAMDGVVIVDRLGLIKEWTPRAAAVLGRTREQMIGKELATFVHPDDRAELAARLNAAIASSKGAQRFELRSEGSDGRPVVFELSMTRLDHVEGVLVAAFMHDITDQKRIEAEKARAFDEVSRQKRHVERERDYLRQERRPSVILGESAAHKHALELCSAVADTESSVLLLGESGVGKELFAAAVHERSARASGPFVKVNCASVPGTLFESEFFGHAKGSFTGAVKDRVGRFELADRGTLFLDEVGEIPIELQAKLLRVLQEGEIERVGEDRTRRLDVRIVAATNRDLASEVEAGRFRSDLYFRLGVFPISIPPLRARGSDVVLLARHFLQHSAREARRTGLTLSASDEARLLAYEWPGNIRELEHVIERAVILSRTGTLRLDLALPDRASVPGGARPSAAQELLREDDLRKLERENLVTALKRAGGRVSGPGGAAELLGMNPSTLRDRMKSFRISRTD